MKRSRLRIPDRRLLGAAALALAGVLAAATRITIGGHWQGLFVLRGKDGFVLELKDDLVLGDASRLLASVQFSAARRFLRGPGRNVREAHLELEWDEADGSGIIRNHFADGTELVTLFGRYEDSNGRIPHGLFVGGALPEVEATGEQQNESGMAYRDARGWSHIWCSVNEGIEDDAGRMIFPSSFDFLGSRVLISDAHRVVLESNHEIALAGGPVRMDRFAYFSSGEPFFELGIRLVNLGDRDVHYSYVYGDEPWVGDFGSSEGNVGWLAQKIVPFEGEFDVEKNRWAGILDRKTGIANYIEWIGEDLPDNGYFSNRGGEVRPASRRIPLSSNEVFVGLEWRNRSLHAREARSMRLAVGMAERGPDGKPVRPRAAAERR